MTDIRKYQLIGKRGITDHCEICGKTEDKRLSAGYVVCYECYEKTKKSYCPGCGEEPRGRRPTFCKECLERQKKSVVERKMRPLTDGEKPRCVYPNCLECPLDDCHMEASDLRRMGVSLKKEVLFPCLDCGKDTGSLVLTRCAKCSKKRAERARLAEGGIW